MWFFLEFALNLVTAGAFARSNSTPTDRIINRVLFVLLIGMAITVCVLAQNHH